VKAVEGTKVGGGFENDGGNEGGEDSKVGRIRGRGGFEGVEFTRAWRE
jgi:hypothetical protein